MELITGLVTILSFYILIIIILHFSFPEPHYDWSKIDLENSDVGPINILKKINGKKIKSVEVLVKLED